MVFEVLSGSLGQDAQACEIGSMAVNNTKTGLAIGTASLQSYKTRSPIDGAVVLLFMRSPSAKPLTPGFE